MPSWCLASWTMSPVQWTAGELNPDFRHAKPASCPLDEQPISSSGDEGNRTLKDPVASRALSQVKLRPQLLLAAEVRQGIEPSLPRLPRRRAAVAPADLRVIPDGIEPSSPPCKRGIVGHWTTGSRVLRTSVVGRRQSARPKGLSFLPSTVVLRWSSRDTGIRTRTSPILSRMTPASWSMSLCVQYSHPDSNRDSSRNWRLGPTGLPDSPMRAFFLPSPLGERGWG
jgi:hypothetical protein